MALDSVLRSYARTVWNRFPTVGIKSGHLRNFYCFSSKKCTRDKVDVDQKTSTSTKDAQEFRVYEIPGLKKQDRKWTTRPPRPPVPPDRSLQLSPDHDWTNVWPTRSVFKASVIPFPVRQGVIKSREENEGVSPGRYANAELMKIPNFLHLTPAHIKAHCKAMKKFCTPWPQGLDTDEKCEEHFPLEMKSSSYLSSGPSIRNPKARSITYKIKVSSLGLDYHAKDKLQRLAGDRFNAKTGELVLFSDRCPLVKQNKDFALYLITALFYESKKVEGWEEDKTEADMEQYFWDISQSKRTILRLLSQIQVTDQQQESLSEKSQETNPVGPTDVDILQLKEVQDYKNATTNLINSGESSENLKHYKEAVIKLLKIKQ